MRTITGLNKALAVSLERIEGGTLVRVGAQDWVDQIVVGAVGLAIYPLLKAQALMPPSNLWMPPTYAGMPPTNV